MNIKKTIKLKRVPYANKKTKEEDKEYQVVNMGFFSPVGTLNDWKKKFPGYEIEIVKEKKE